MNHVFVIQARDLAQRHLPNTYAWLKLHHTPAGNVWRIPIMSDAKIPLHVVAELNAACADFAILPDIAFQDIGCLVSDMDSTLITIECIDEIAAQAGLKAQVAAITEHAMQGELDFAQSLRQRVALLAGLPETALQHVYDTALKLSEGAEALLQQCHQHHVAFVLVSGGFTFFTEQLKQRLNLTQTFANELEIHNGVLTGRVLGRIIDAQAKAQILAACRAKYGKITLAIGDGANDIPMLQSADIGIAYHAKPRTQQVAKICINHHGLDSIPYWFS